jgi:hypothetical protein
MKRERLLRMREDVALHLWTGECATGHYLSWTSCADYLHMNF